MNNTVSATVGATIGTTVGLVVVAGGVAAARVLHFKRLGDRHRRRLENKDLDSRRHHFAGRVDLELPDRGS